MVNCTVINQVMEAGVNNVINLVIGNATEAVTKMICLNLTTTGGNL